MGGKRDFNKKALRIVEVTANTTLTPAHCNGEVLITNRGATGTVTVTLPPRAKGLRVRFLRIAAQALRVDPQTADQLRDEDGTLLTAGKYQELGSTGAMLEYIADSAAWNHVYERGTINNEA